MPTWARITFATLVGATLALLAVAYFLARDVPPTPATTTEATYPEGIAAACEGYEAAFADWLDGGTDQRYAGALEDLASGDAAGTPLEGPLDELAAGLRRGDATLPDTVTPICRGETPTTLSGDEAERQTRYLDAVRSAVPGIQDGDNDLLEAIDMGCGLLDRSAEDGDMPTNRDQLLAMAWAPLNDIDDAEHVLREGVPIFCPQHGDVVESLLG